jgi:hypothetical protein
MTLRPSIKPVRYGPTTKYETLSQIPILCDTQSQFHNSPFYLSYQWLGQHHFTASVGIFRDSCSSTPCISYTYHICCHVGRTDPFTNVLELSATPGQIFLYIWHTAHTYSNSNRFYAKTKIVITLKVWSRIIHDKQVLPQAVKTFPCIIVFIGPATYLPSDISVQSTHSTLFKTHFNIILNKRAGFEVTFSLHVWSPSSQMHFSVFANISTV